MRHVLFAHHLIVENFASRVDHIPQGADQRTEAFVPALFGRHLAGTNQTVTAGQFIHAVITELRLECIHPRLFQPRWHLLFARQPTLNALEPATGCLHELADIVQPNQLIKIRNLSQLDLRSRNY
ncbi:hypothetical protein D9M71_726450 [compost metagenome]